jgi:heme exporter protein B
MIPTLIFGTATTTSPHPLAPMLMLAAMLAAALPLAPIATGAALRATVE